jgi:hypothetical protein
MAIATFVFMSNIWIFEVPQCFFVKGRVAREFRPSFFHQWTPPRALIHRLKPFCIWPNIRRKNRQYSNIGVNYPADTTRIFLTKFFVRNYETIQTFIEKFQPGHWPRWNDFSGVIDPAEAISASHWHRGIRLYCQSSPLIYMFSSNYVYVMFAYVFLYAMVSL